MKRLLSGLALCLALASPVLAQTPPTPQGGAAVLSPGATPVTPSTNGGVLYDKAGVLGDSTTLPAGIDVQGRRTPYFYGAVGNGVADDTSAIQQWATWMAAGNNGFCATGTYRITASVNAFSSVGYQADGSGVFGCIIYTDFNGWGQAAIDLTNPSSPSSATRGAQVRWSHIGFTYNHALTAPPIAFQDRWATGLFLDDVRFNQYTVNRGTVLALSSAWNTRLTNVQVWGAGGNYSSHLVNTNTTFSIASGARTLTSSQAEFASSDVGAQILVKGGTYPESFTITAFTDNQTVTVSRNASVTHTAVQGAFSTISGTITAASPTLTTSASRLTSADVGRVVYVPAAGNNADGLSSLRAQVTAASGASVTLNKNAVNSSSTAPLIIDPAINIYGEVDSQNNDVFATDLHAEENAGVSLVADHCYICTFLRTKIETNQPTHWGTTDLDAEAVAAFLTTDGFYGDGEWQGPNTTNAAIWTQNSLTTFVLGPTIESLLPGMPLLGAANNGLGSSFTIGAIGIDQQTDPAWIPNLFSTDGTSIIGLASKGAVSALNTAAPSGGQLINGFTVAGMIGTSGIPIVIPSGNGSTVGNVGNNGAVSAETAIPNAYSDAYCYMPVNSIASGVAAGLYYCTWSDTTHFTLYNNTYDPTSCVPPTIPTSPTPFATTGPGFFTQTTGSYIEAICFTVPANSMGANGSFVVKAVETNNNSGNSKSLQIRFNGTAVCTAAETTGVATAAQAQIVNRGRTDKQVNMTSPLCLLGNIVSNINYPSADTTAARVASLWLQQATAGADFITLEAANVQLNPSP